jgi:hypothetical protein
MVFFRVADLCESVEQGVGRGGGRGERGWGESDRGKTGEGKGGKGVAEHFQAVGIYQE